jgi:hypothetical protein
VELTGEGGQHGGRRWLRSSPCAPDGGEGSTKTPKGGNGPATQLTERGVTTAATCGSPD